MLIDADLAQLAEHVISNDEVEGSNPLVSTKSIAIALNSAVYERC